MTNALFILLTFIFSNPVWAQNSSSMTNQTGATKSRIPTNTMGAPTVNSTEGPAGRPNTELAPSTTGTINSLTPSTEGSAVTPLNRWPRRSMNGYQQPTQPIDPMLPPNTTSPLPTNTN